MKDAFVAALRDMHSCGIEIGYLAIETYKSSKKNKTTGIYHFDSIALYGYYPEKSRN